MPNITQLPIITTVTNTTTFVVIDKTLTRRVSYQTVKNQLSNEIVKSTLATLTDVNTTGVTDGQVLKYNSEQSIWIPALDISGTSTSGLSSRVTRQAVTPSIADNETSNVSITGFKSYALLKVQTTAAAWVRLYTTSQARTSDNSRSQGTDPTPGTGIISEIITTGVQTQIITPGVVGFNDDATPVPTIYAAVTNLSGDTTSITVILTLLQLEV